MAAAIPIIVGLIGAGTSLYTANQQPRSAKKASVRANARADAIQQKEADKLRAFRGRLSSGGRGLLGSTGDDNLGSTLGS